MTGVQDPEASQTERQALVVDRDPRVVDQVRDAFSRMGIRCTTADAIPDALAAAEVHPPDLLICDVDLGQQNLGLHLADTVRRRWQTSIVLMTARVDAEAVIAIAAVEPCGLLCKPLQRQQVEATLRFAFHRRAFEQKRVAAARAVGRRAEDARRSELEAAMRQIAALIVRAGVVDVERSTDESTALLAGLRPREQEVVRLLLQNYRAPAIAQQLGISPQTVRNHLKSVYRRTGVNSQQELLERFRTPALTVVSSRETPRITDPRTTGAAERRRHVHTDLDLPSAGAGTER